MESPPDNVGEGIMFFWVVRPPRSSVRSSVRSFIRPDTDRSCYHDIS